MRQASVRASTEELECLLREQSVAPQYLEALRAISNCLGDLPTPFEEEAQHPATTHQTEFPAQQHQQRSNVSSRAGIEAEHESIVQSECAVPLPPPQVELPEFELPGIWLCTAHLDS